MPWNQRTTDCPKLIDRPKICPDWPEIYPGWPEIYPGWPLIAHGWLVCRPHPSNLRSVTDTFGLPAAERWRPRQSHFSIFDSFWSNVLARNRPSWLCSRLRKFPEVMSLWQRMWMIPWILLVDVKSSYGQTDKKLYTASSGVLRCSAKAGVMLSVH